MGYFVPESVGSAGVGNQKSRGEVFSGVRRRNLPSSRPKRPEMQAFRGVAPATSTPGMRYYGYRYYNPEMGRWVNRDPIEEQGGIAVYSFVFNSPVLLIDMLGHFAIPPIRFTLPADPDKCNLIDLLISAGSVIEDGRISGNPNQRLWRAWRDGDASAVVTFDEFDAGRVKRDEMERRIDSVAEGGARGAADALPCDSSSVYLRGSTSAHRELSHVRMITNWAYRMHYAFTIIKSCSPCCETRVLARWTHKGWDDVDFNDGASFSGTTEWNGVRIEVRIDDALVNRCNELMGWGAVDFRISASEDGWKEYTWPCR